MLHLLYRWCVSLTLLAFAVSQALAQVNVLTWHNNPQRSGANPLEIILTSGNVNANTFGLLFVINVDGKVDAQPLYASGLTIAGVKHNVLFVATEQDSIYTFDADTGSFLWHRSLLGPGESPSDDRGCGEVFPVIGVTATPVIVPAYGPHGTIYVVAMSKDGLGQYYQRLHALDITNGTEEFGGPVTIAAKYPGTGDSSSGGYVTFHAAQHKERAALLDLNGVIYLAFSSHCDNRPYTGWIMGYHAESLRPAGLINVTPNGSGGTVWMSGAGLAATGTDIFFLVANGTFDTRLDASGFPSKGDYGNAFMKLDTAGRNLRITDYFTMSTTTSESLSDTDLGSGGVLLLPGLPDTQRNLRSLAVGAGKDGNIYVVDRNNLGKYSPQTNNIYQELRGALPGGAWSSPAWFSPYLYYGPVGGPIQAFRYFNGKFGAQPTSQTAHSFPYPGATPSISSNGNSNAILWAAEYTIPGVLHAYDALDLSKELYNSNQAAKDRDHFGAGKKFITPTIANGKVYVGTTNGVGVFGLLR